MEERLSRTVGLLGEQAVAKLKKAHIAVIGIGGVGSWCAEALVRTGVGELTLLDFDCVAPSNLNRQNEALVTTLGQPKTEALAERLRAIDPAVVLHLLPVRCDEAGREALFSMKPDAVADCIDSVQDKCDLIGACIEREIPVVSSMGTGGKLDASRLRLEDLKKTHTDGLARAVRRELKKRGIEHVPVVWSDEEPKTQPGKPGTVMWVPAAAGLLIAQKLITELIKE